ncbi:sigma-70 family RNA polymerase sigma factor [Allokutzneria sp. A3M-2-11 16]|uniref:RNA polymerase sigma factor n=1 Tax=Allokutzneria sp. A3M-2-11 16 TaxID=2962043 RepID=UPI0020B84A77|nr:sigma-70 family RNA polymerase sigma factor [Allokutzneria sp. A3M-2-11 16]MCP3801067.1 sigma-70 family RNA polymerase sigma factor [Allokutzneria sp. A3M-2-11 16]
MVTLSPADRARLLAVLVADLRDFDLAEDVLSEAVLAALGTWPERGEPANPHAWLLTTARRKALDHLRRNKVFAEKLRLLGATLTEDELAAEPPSRVVDERLRLIFTCCHPALAMPARVALALRYLGGLSTAEVARMFLVTESAMAARLTTAKKKIALARIPYAVPADSELPHRLPAVLAVVELIFTEGYAATAGSQLVREELCERALGFARLLAELMPEEPEARALLALLLFQDSRRRARVDDEGRLVLFADQDRTLWNHKQIAEGIALVENAPATPYAIRAAIAAAHARDETDWPRAAELYALLETVAPSPVVTLNRAVAVGFAEGPAVGLGLLDRLVEARELPRSHLLFAARAEFLRSLGRTLEAIAAYDTALSLATNPVERDHLARRRALADS